MKPHEPLSVAEHSTEEAVENSWYAACGGGTAGSLPG